MRRTDREIQSREAIDQIIHAAGVFHLGLCQGDSPYVVPLSFGYDGEIYLLSYRGRGHEDRLYDF